MQSSTMRKQPYHLIYSALNTVSVHSKLLLSAVYPGKTSSTAWGYETCLHIYSVLFTTAADAINTLSVCQSTEELKNDHCLSSLFLATSLSTSKGGTPLTDYQQTV
jgi:hypothetical protein